jgi:hypothetical protein
LHDLGHGVGGYEITVFWKIIRQKRLLMTEKGQKRNRPKIAQKHPYLLVEGVAGTLGHIFHSLRNGFQYNENFWYVTRGSVARQESRKIPKTPIL